MIQVNDEGSQTVTITDNRHRHSITGNIFYILFCFLSVGKHSPFHLHS